MGLLSSVWDVIGRFGRPDAQLGFDGDERFEIVGESYFQDALSKICGGPTPDGVRYACEARLLLDDRNPYDSNAVAVHIGGRLVGYLSRGDAIDFRRELERIGLRARTFVCSALINGGWDRGGGRSGHFGVELELSFPLRVEAD